MTSSDGNLQQKNEWSFILATYDLICIIEKIYAKDECRKQEYGKSLSYMLLGNQVKMECQYVATQRGGIALLFEGHRYNKVRDGKEGTVYWRCARDRQCPGRAVTVYSRIKKANNKHNHPPDTWRNKVDQVVSDLKLRSQEDVTALPTLFTETLKCLAANPNMATLASMVPSLPALKSSLYRSRHRTMPTLVPFRDFCPDDDWAVTNNVDNSGASTSEPLDMAVKNTSVLLKRLRSLMKNTNYVSETLQAYVIPQRDCHQSEYLAPCDRRRSFITGFSGNSGTAIVTEDHAALWTDKKYFQQAEQQLDHNWTLMKEGLAGTPTQGDWLCKILPIGSRVGVDPYLISYEWWKPLYNQLEMAGHHLVSVAQNLIDFIWDDRPPPPVTIIEPLPLSYSGKSLGEKINEMRQEIIQNDAVALVITALDEIAWLFNLRGCDVDYNPVFFAYSIVTLETIYLFVDENKLTSSVRRHLQSDDNEYSVKIEIRPYKLVKDCLGWLVNQLSGKIWISKKSSYALVSIVPQARRIEITSPVLSMKAVKNEVEIECMRQAHVKDGVAVCEFFSWLNEEVAHGEITEPLAANKLEEFRRQQEDYVSSSFETVSASGANSADMYYRPTEETFRVITSDELYLCDCGAHYRDGTTVVSRTVHFGTPSQYEKECFTRVVKGHVALASAVFPRMTKGQMLDTLARKFLWEVGLDYSHSTGHGVGAYLNVHEAPIEISCKYNPDDPGLQEGMILSAEPAYYEEGQFGVKVKNVIVVKAADTKFNVKEHSFLTFEPLTLVPIQVKLLDPTLLTVEEVEWIDNYHQTCRDIVGKALKEQGKHSAFQWLLKETQPLG